MGLEVPNFARMRHTREDCGKYTISLMETELYAAGRASWCSLGEKNAATPQTFQEAIHMAVAF